MADAATLHERDFSRNFKEILMHPDVLIQVRRRSRAPVRTSPRASSAK